MWWEDGFDPLGEPGFVDGLTEALLAHRRFAGMSRVVLPRTARHRDLARELRPLLRSDLNRARSAIRLLLCDDARTTSGRGET